MKNDLDKYTKNARDNIANDKGSSLVELTMVMTLFILFCITIYSLIDSGSEVQRKIINNKDAEIDARITLSYVTTKLRHNDKAEKISVEKNPLTEENAIVIREREENANYDTWIYFFNNTLYEFIGLSGEIPRENLSIPILQSDGIEYKIEYDQESNSILNTITYQYGNGKKEISHNNTLRSKVYY